MTTVMTTTKQWQDQYLTMMARVEEPIVRYAGKAAGAVASYVPERPQWAFLDQVPTMTELVESQLKFRKRMVDEQAAFVRKFIKAISPATARHEPKAPAVKRMVAKASPARRVGFKAA
ncbi:MAG: hypothetical protein ABI706_18770 [Ilumatobacteraceae bacterium]